MAGGNTTAYAYPQDPVNKYDLDGKAWGWLKKAANVAKVVAKVAEVASFIPGPIGMVAAGVATAGYLVAGDYKAAASAAIGLVPGGKLLATVGKAAVAGAAAYGAYKAGKAAVTVVRIVKAAGKARGMAPGVGKEIVTSASVSNLAGRIWVGRGARIASDGRTIVSRNGLRQYRPPTTKTRTGYHQSNFQSRSVPKGPWLNNYHVGIRR